MALMKHIATKVETQQQKDVHSKAASSPPKRWARYSEQPRVFLDKRKHMCWWRALPLKKTTRLMRHHNSLILTLKTPLATSTPPSHIKIPCGCDSYQIQPIIAWLQWCTQSGYWMDLHFNPQKRFQHLEVMGIILNLDVHPIRPCRSQGPCSIPKDFSRTGTERIPFRRWTPH